MAAYAETRKVAHVMVWHSGGWISLCGEHERLFETAPYPIVRFTHDDPTRGKVRTRPWCSYCTKKLRDMAEDVLP